MYRLIAAVIAGALTFVGLLVLRSANHDAVTGSLASEEQPSVASANDSTEDDERILREAHVGTDGPSLLAFFRERTATDQELKNPDLLIRQLGSDRFPERERVARILVGLGARVLPNIKRALADPDSEIAERAKTCLREIERGVRTDLPIAAVRLLVRREEAEAVQALFGYLPSSPSEDVVGAIWYNFNALVVRCPKTIPMLTEVLRDPLPERRALAACILGRVGDRDQRAMVRNLLVDDDPMVRLRAAQGLLAAKDKSAISALIKLLNEPQVELSWQAEELLHWVAGQHAPRATVGAASAEAREQCRSAWQSWWDSNRAKLDFANLAPNAAPPGLMLICAVDRPRATWGRIYLCGCDGTARWQLQQIETPFVAQLLVENRIFVAEAGDKNRISERDLQGNIVWQRILSEDLVAASHLANGNTFLATLKRVMEVGPDQRQIYSHDVFRAGLVGLRNAQKLTNGRILCNTYLRSEDHHLAELDPVTGKVVRDCPIDQHFRGSYFQIGTSACGNLLLALPGKVVEVDKTGKCRAEFPVNRAANATVLWNRNLLVNCGEPRRPRIVEMNISGRIIRHVSPTYPDAFASFPVCLELVRFGFGFDNATLP